MSRLQSKLEETYKSVIDENNLGHKIQIKIDEIEQKPRSQNEQL